jgi:hypothetical protein
MARMATQTIGTCSVLILSQVQTNAPASPFPYGILPLIFSFLAFVVALLNYRRKAGMLVRGTFSMTSSQESNGMYLSSLVIENLKDRAITVFAIYLRLGSNYYIQIEDFETKPLILRAFETYQKQYGPIEFYGVNTKRINLDGLFHDKNTKMRLVLSTSDGKFAVPGRLRKWSPVDQYFRNYLTAVVRPVRGRYKDKDIGGGVKYVIDILNEDGTEEVIPIHPRDFEVQLFRRFDLTREALETQETLEAFLQEQIGSGKLVCKKCTVFDVQRWRAEARRGYSGETVKATSYSAFQYYVMGRITTIYLSWKQRRANTKEAPTRRPFESSKEETVRLTPVVVLDSSHAEESSDGNEVAAIRPESPEAYVTPLPIAEIVAPVDEAKGQSEISAPLEGGGDPLAPRPCEDSSDDSGGSGDGEDEIGTTGSDVPERP